MYIALCSKFFWQITGFLIIANVFRNYLGYGVLVVVLVIIIVAGFIVKKYCCDVKPGVVFMRFVKSAQTPGPEKPNSATLPLIPPSMFQFFWSILFTVFRQKLLLCFVGDFAMRQVKRNSHTVPKSSEFSAMLLGQSIIGKLFSVVAFLLKI